MEAALSTQHTLLSLCADLYWQMDLDGRCLTVFNYAAKTERAAHAMQNSALYSLIPKDQGQALRELLAQQRPFRQFLARLQLEEGTCYLLITGAPQFDSQQSFLYYECVAIDFTGLRASDASLQRFRAAMDMSMDMIYLVDRDTLSYLDVNDTACKTLNLSREQLLALGPGKTLGFSDAELIERYDRLIAEGGSSRLERRIKRPQGEDSIVEVFSSATCIDERWVIIGVARDVSARKQAERRSLHLQRIFSALSLTNEAILRAETEQDLFDNSCAAAVSSGLFTIASILIPRPNGKFKAIANAGNYTRQPEKVLISTSPDLPEGRGLTSEAYRSAQCQISNDYKHDERSRPWHHLAQEFDIGSAAAYPLTKRKSVVAVMLFYAKRSDVFDQQTQAILQSMADNISFALDNFAADAEQLRAADIIRQNEERFRSLTNLTSDFYWEMDAALRFVSYEGRVIGETNRVAIRQMIGKHIWELPGVRPDAIDWKTLKRLLKRARPFRDYEFAFANADGVQFYFALSGEPVFDEEQQFIGYRGISRDITEKKRTANHIKHLATHDMLTGLPNRVMFTELLSSAVRTANRYKDNQFAVLFIDLDRFKAVNDTYGHHAGDKLLAELATRLKLAVRASDIVARLGGDEFVVLLHKVAERELAISLAKNILEIFNLPVKVEQRELMVSGSIGISLYGVDALTEEELMNHADTAMYAAKEEGRNSVNLYSAQLHQHTQERASLSVQLRHAMKQNQLYLFYQAKVDMCTGQVVGVEALLRWRHPELGEISPAQFIPIAEDNGLILPIGAWVLDTALRQIKQIDQMQLPPLNLAVNLSARQFNHPNLGQFIADALHRAEFPAHRLELEITESLVAQNPDRAMELIQDIKKMGVRFALDDFGTGYSSLGQLRHYPFDTLKIDRAFVRDLANSKEDQAISKAIISMGKTLGMTVVAEGVETIEQLAFLRKYQCDQTQGYFCHKPSTAQELIVWYQQRLNDGADYCR